MNLSKSQRQKEFIGTDCVICNFPITDVHRLIPGGLGGTYADANCVPLCPNHHRATHFAIRWHNAHFTSWQAQLLAKIRKGDAHFAAFFDAVHPYITDIQGMSFEERSKAMYAIHGAFLRWNEARKRGAG